MNTESDTKESETSATTDGNEIVFRRPQLADGKAVFDFIQECGVLEVNTAYCYFLLCSHFAGTCVIAEQDGKMVGFLGGYIEPSDQSSYFVWQVGVAAEARGQGLARRLIDSALSRNECRDVYYVEATVAPSNKPSSALFHKLAKKYDAPVEVLPFLKKEHFGALDHEEEELFRIGPISKQTRTTGA
mgnify:CR=1 FL=1